MAVGTYYIITIAGGVGGAALAKAMAEHGARVLVLERETQFKDRVRGELIVPWGVAEARELGIDTLLRSACGQDLPYLQIQFGSVHGKRRDLRTTTPQGLAALAVYHPAMQEIVLQAAAEAGAEVRRGVIAREIKREGVTTVVVEQDGRMEAVQARLAIGADGRGSLVRKWSRFPVRQDPEQLLIAGVLFDDMPLPPDDTNYGVFNFPLGQETLIFPQGQGRVRAYFVCRTDGPDRLQGAADVPRFVAESVRAGAPNEWFAGARAIGPLATFTGAATWVEHPYQAGVALIGDAAGASDPTWGQELSLTLRDVRVLRDQLLHQNDWETAGHAYAEEHDRYFNVIHVADNWKAELFYAAGPEADARRDKALSLIAQDPTRAPDHAWSGPEVPLNETVRRRFFGEE
jgi:2-polyprenyl-6-methoxyphenol hydroxylase-like FAD-dependent oxidoreductase